MFQELLKALKPDEVVSFSLTRDGNLEVTLRDGLFESRHVLDRREVVCAKFDFEDYIFREMRYQIEGLKRLQAQSTKPLNEPIYTCKNKKCSCAGMDFILSAPYDIVCQHIFATIDPSPDEPITADWLREVWGWHDNGTMSMHYEHDEYTALSWNQNDGLSIVAKSYQMRCYTTGFPMHNRQQFCDLARCLGITRKDGAK